MTEPQGAQLELSGAHLAELCQAMVKAVRALTLYLPNNPIYQRAVEQVCDHLLPAWEATDELRLDVRETSLVWGEEVVYHHEVKSESFAWTLYKDGLRSLTLLPGVEQEEIVRFLELIVRVRSLPPEASDDLLTLLWEQDFERLSYTFTDLLAEGAAPLTAEGGATAATPEEVTQQVAEEAPSRAGTVSLDEFDSTLYFLEEGEIGRLQDEIHLEYQRDLRQSVLAVLFDLLEIQRDSAVRDEVLGILSDFLPYLLGAGDYRSVGYLLREARVVQGRAGDLDPSQRARLADLPGRLSHPPAIEQLLQSLDSALTPPTPQELGELFGEIRPDAFPALLAWIERLGTPSVRDVVEAAAERLAGQHPPALVSALVASEAVVVRYAARIAGRLRVAAAVASLGKQLSNDDLPVRLAAAEGLAAIATAGALQALVSAVNDASREVRLVAVRALGSRRFRNALGAVEAAVGQKGRGADLTEKMALFEAYGLIGGPAAVARLEPMLLAGGLFRRRADPETRACAALALGKVGTPEARAALERARTDKEVLVRNAVAQALRETEP